MLTTILEREQDLIDELVHGVEQCLHMVFNSPCYSVAEKRHKAYGAIDEIARNIQAIYANNDSNYPADSDNMVAVSAARALADARIASLRAGVASRR